MRLAPHLFAAAALALASPAFAAPAPWYLGGWKITAAVPAPWVQPGHPPSAAEKRSLMGRTVWLRRGEIAGPRDFTCKEPHYEVVDFTADMLFEGELAEMQSENPKANPEKLAASVGFVGSKWKTVETGCEIDWHFPNAADLTTAKIGLNDWVYTLKKQ